MHLNLIAFVSSNEIYTAKAYMYPFCVKLSVGVFEYQIKEGFHRGKQLKRMCYVVHQFVVSSLDAYYTAWNSKAAPFLACD